MDNNKNLPKRCERFKNLALKSCEIYNDPTICKDIINNLTIECNKWLKTNKKDEYSINKKNP